MSGGARQSKASTPRNFADSAPQGSAFAALRTEGQGNNKLHETRARGDLDFLRAEEGCLVLARTAALRRSLASRVGGACHFLEAVTRTGCVLA